MEIYATRGIKGEYIRYSSKDAKWLGELCRLILNASWSIEMDNPTYKILKEEIKRE